MARRETPSGLANGATRLLLTATSNHIAAHDVQWLFSPDYCEKALDYFKDADGRPCCAYTGEVLEEGKREWDHAYPMNKQHAGLTVAYNMVPSSRKANNKKAGKSYRDFYEAKKMRLFTQERYEHLQEWVQNYESALPHWRQLFLGQELSSICQDFSGQFRSDIVASITKRCEQIGIVANFSQLLGGEGTVSRPILELEPADEDDFLELFLDSGQGKIEAFNADGQCMYNANWKTSKFTEESSLSGNVWSRPKLRKQSREALGIVRVKLTALDG